MKKQELRLWARNARKHGSFETYDKIITEKIRFNNLYTSSQKLMLYYPLPIEINILSLLNDNKKFYFPCIQGDKILPYELGEEFTKGAFNIQEPLNTNPIDPKELDLVIVPALCVDKNGYRVGYGKGFYDRFIKELDRTKTQLLVPIYDELVVDDIAPDDFDEKVDIIVTEKRIIETVEL